VNGWPHHPLAHGPAGNEQGQRCKLVEWRWRPCSLPLGPFHAAYCFRSCAREQGGGRPGLPSRC